MSSDRRIPGVDCEHATVGGEGGEQQEAPDGGEEEGGQGEDGELLLVQRELGHQAGDCTQSSCSHGEQAPFTVGLEHGLVRGSHPRQAEGGL